MLRSRAPGYFADAQQAQSLQHSRCAAAHSAVTQVVSHEKEKKEEWRSHEKGKGWVTTPHSPTWSSTHCLLCAYWVCMSLCHMWHSHSDPGFLWAACMRTGYAYPSTGCGPVTLCLDKCRLPVCVPSTRICLEGRTAQPGRQG